MLLFVRAQLCPALCDPMDYIVHQAPLSMEFSRKQHWSGLPFAALGDLLDPEIELASPASPALAGRFFTFEPRKRAARNGRNPQTGKAIKIPAKTVPVFSAGKKFKEVVNGK